MQATQCQEKAYEPDSDLLHANFISSAGWHFAHVCHLVGLALHLLCHLSTLHLPKSSWQLFRFGHGADLCLGVDHLIRSLCDGEVSMDLSSADTMTK